MTVLVVGGTGTVGSRAVLRLADRDVRVRVLSRSPERLTELPRAVEGVVGDLEVPESLFDVFRGIDRVFLVTPLSESEVVQGRNAARAAAHADVEHLVYLSVHDVETGDQIPHFRSKIEIERVLRENGVPTSLVMPNNFFQNDLWLRTAIAEQGIYPQPIGASTCLSRVDAGDIAEAAIRLLVGDREPGARIPVVGPDCLNGPEVARIWSRHLGREVTYAGDDLESWGNAMSERMPDWMIEDLKTMYAFYQQHGLSASPEDLEATREILGREPRSFAEWVRETAAGWS